MKTSNAYRRLCDAREEGRISGTLPCWSEIEVAYFGQPDAEVKPTNTARKPFPVHPDVHARLTNALMYDDRFNASAGNGIGYSEFITRALNALGCP